MRSSSSSAAQSLHGLHIEVSQFWKLSMMSLHRVKTTALDEELGVVALLQSSSLPASITMANRTRLERGSTRLEVHHAAVVYYPRIRV